MNQAAALTGRALNAVSLVSPWLAGETTYRIFRLPLKRARPRAGERALLERARTARVRIDGETAVTYRWGSGERPVLLAHGWQSRGTCFEHFVPGLLEAGYSPVAYDAPGHGDATGATTTVLAFREVIQHLADEHGTFEAVISHSVGALASVLALRSGVRTRRLVAISQVGEFAHLFDGFCGQLALRQRVRDELRTRMEQRLFPREHDIWRHFSTTYAPERITVPILIVHDEQDRVVGVDQARRMAEVFGGQARLVTTRGLGHRRILADPAVVESTLDFVTAAQDGTTEVPAASR
ncbi:alpha/beta fold hydrolase [Streptomyces sp. NPDC015220]|uniref:alpha/beta fold hydrolase n=1 Tax=Streptomyces sp. NPDC015220 TaxID=3364947 RepID=UPI0036FAF0B5